MEALGALIGFGIGVVFGIFIRHFKIKALKEHAANTLAFLDSARGQAEEDVRDLIEKAKEQLK